MQSKCTVKDLQKLTKSNAKISAPLLTMYLKNKTVIEKSNHFVQ